MIDKFHFFQGLDLLNRASLLREKVQHLETEGLEKIKVAVAGSEAEGLYGPLTGAMLHSSMSFGPSQPKRTWSLQSCNRRCKTGTRSCLFHCTRDSRGGHPSQHDTPLPTGGGVKRVYKCWVEGCKEGPLTSHATICAHVCRVHLGVGLMCSSCTKAFFNPDTLRHIKKNHFPQ